jgi:hypothetical protein
VRTLITPAEAFLPNKVLCGPLNTSICCNLGRSPICAAARERYTPSIKIPTEGSIPVLLPPLPKPRIEKLVLVERWSGVTRYVGTSVCKSPISSTLACSIA